MALLAVFFLGYVSFLGIVYATKGHIMEAAIAAAIGGTVLFLLSATLQRLKGTAQGFSRNIIAERITALLLVAGCALCAVPFTHFFTVNSHEREVANAFRSALDEVMPMFDEYDSVATHRIEVYERALIRAQNSKKRRATYDLDRHTEGKTQGGDSIIRQNMTDALRLLLLPPEHTRLRQEAQQWVDHAGGATTWNAFLLGNTKEIRHAVEGWRKTMEEALAQTVVNEHSTGTDTLAMAALHAQAAARHLDTVETLCATKAAPTPLALALLALCTLMLFFPHWLQTRHSKSWKRFWPRSVYSMMGANKSTANQCIEVKFGKKTVPFVPKTSAAKDFMTDMRLMAEEKGLTPFEYLMQRFAEKSIDERRLLQLLREDHNLFNTDTIRQLLDRRVFDKETLVTACGIDPQFLDMLNPVPRHLPASKIINSLDSTSTHVFFWGIPTSGKTCALGAILAAAQKGKGKRKKIKVDKACQGKEYYEFLCDVFKADGAYITLPGRTNLTDNYAIRMTIDDGKGREHPVTLIDMAGELFCSILWQDMGYKECIRDEHRTAKQEFERVLIARNPGQQKFHFFIIEYGGEDRGYPQRTPTSNIQPYTADAYLTRGLDYLDKQGVLEHDTEAIYVLLTKTDRMKQFLREGESEKEHLERYLHTYYHGFLYRLNDLCKEYELCDGKLPPIIPINLGEVCLADLCHLNTASANDVVDLLTEKSKGFRKGFAGAIERLFNK